MTHHCGKVCIIGRPNVGKSTFFNQVIGKKISIVTHKSQTTRRQIQGVYTDQSYQMIFIDTPGINTNSAQTQAKALNREALSALFDIDAVIFMLERDRWLPEDEWVLNNIKKYNGPVIAVINKIDQIDSKKIDTLSNQLRNLHDFQMVIPISALKNQQIDVLLDHLKLYMPLQPFQYSPDTQSDIQDQFLVKEIIREKLLLNIHEEIPYIADIKIEEWIKTKQRFSVSIIIHVNTTGQKKILIGHNGQQLKHIGRQSRIDIENNYNQKMHLNIWVKVKRKRV